MKCPRCGTEVRESDKYCKNCGEENPWYVEDSQRPLTNSYVPSHIPHNIAKPASRSESKVVGVIFSLVRVLIYLLIFIGCQGFVMSSYGAALTVSEGLTEADGLYLSGRIAENFVPITLLADLLTLFAISLMQTLRRRALTQELGTKSINFIRLPSFAIFGIALNIIILCLLNMLPIPSSLTNALDDQYAYAYGGTSLALEIVTIAIVVPIVEEVLFRGVILKRLRDKMGKVSAVVISAVLFGLTHGTVLAVAYSFVLGLILAAITIVYDSTIPAIVCHIGFNLTSYVFAGLGGVSPIFLLAMSLVLIVFFMYRIFFRRPTFSDILADRRGQICAENEEEKKFFDEVHALSERDDVTPEVLEDLNSEWDRLLSLRRERRRNGFGKNGSEN